MAGEYRMAESKRGDIKLPNESGRVDPRLKGGEADSERRRQAGQKMRGSLDALRRITDKYKK